MQIQKAFVNASVRFQQVSCPSKYLFWKVDSDERFEQNCSTQGWRNRSTQRNVIVVVVVVILSWFSSWQFWHWYSRPCKVNSGMHSSCCTPSNVYVHVNPKPVVLLGASGMRKWTIRIRLDTHTKFVYSCYSEENNNQNNNNNYNNNDKVQNKQPDWRRENRRIFTDFWST